MKKIFFVSALLMMAIFSNAQQRKAGKGQQEFLIVKTVSLNGQTTTTTKASVTTAEPSKLASLVETLVAPIRKLFVTEGK